MIRPAFLVLLAALAGDPPLADFAAQVEAAYPGTPTMSAEQVLAHDAPSAPILVDARTEEERAVSMLPGAITPGALDQLPPDAQRVVVVYCTIGMRSAELTRRLREQGRDAYNLRGGVLAWAGAGGRFVDPAGGSTRRVHVYGARWNHLPGGFEPVW